jgi:hypothetical protein
MSISGPIIVIDAVLHQDAVGAHTGLAGVAVFRGDGALDGQPRLEPVDDLHRPGGLGEASELPNSAGLGRVSSRATHRFCCREQTRGSSGYGKTILNLERPSIRRQTYEPFFLMLRPYLAHDQTEPFDRLNRHGDRLRRVGRGYYKPSLGTDFVDPRGHAMYWPVTPPHALHHELSVFVAPPEQPLGVKPPTEMPSYNRIQGDPFIRCDIQSSRKSSDNGSGVFRRTNSFRITRRQPSAWRRKNFTSIRGVLSDRIIGVTNHHETMLGRRAPIQPNKMAGFSQYVSPIPKPRHDLLKAL